MAAAQATSRGANPIPTDRLLSFSLDVGAEPKNNGPLSYPSPPLPPKPLYPKPPQHPPRPPSYPLNLPSPPPGTVCPPYPPPKPKSAGMGSGIFFDAVAIAGDAAMDAGMAAGAGLAAALDR
jgi:hypothetical protein